MEVEKPLPPSPLPLLPCPALGFQVTSRYIWGSLLGASLFPLHFSRGRVQRGQAAGWPEQIPAQGPGGEKVPGGAPEVGPLGSRLGLGQRERGVGETCQRPSLVFIHPPPSLSASHLSLLQLPSANIFPFLFLSYSSHPLPEPPLPPPPPSLLSRSQLGKSFHLNPLLPALNVSPVSFPTGTCIVSLIPNRSIWRQATLGDSGSLRVGGAGSG